MTLCPALLECMRGGSAKCHRQCRTLAALSGLTLLYVGIAPKAPSANGAPRSTQTLRHRIRYHMRGNAYGSTLRLTLGCLLSKQLGIELRRVGAGTRMTFAHGEARLSEWMSANAFVSWFVTPTPWEAESRAISSICLPLNLAQNKSHAFHTELSACRAAARVRARELPVV